MSHFKERTAKNCLNCNAIVAGKYCQVCGQENIEPKESFWHLVTHFFNDITHFDGKFFTTTKLLLLKPGYLAKAYLQGKRASYLHPIRMYVFTSFVFFLLFFTITDSAIDFGEMSEGELKRISNQIKIDGIDSMIADTRDTSILKALNIKKTEYKNANLIIDSVEDARILVEKRKKQQTITPSNNKPKVETSDSLVRSLNDSAKGRNRNSKLRFGSSFPDSVTTVAQYEKYQASLPEADRDSWLTKKMAYKKITIQEKYRYNGNEFGEILIETFLHSLPKMLFISLPLFALVLQLLYFRQKHLYYTDHGVFSIYYFIAVFIILLFDMLIKKLQTVTGWQIFNYVEPILILFILFYLYKSMRNFYGQRRGKTILKFILLCTLSSFVTLVLTVGLLLITFLKV